MSLICSKQYGRRKSQEQRRSHACLQGAEGGQILNIKHITGESHPLLSAGQEEFGVLQVKKEGAQEQRMYWREGISWEAQRRPLYWARSFGI